MHSSGFEEPTGEGEERQADDDSVEVIAEPERLRSTPFAGDDAHQAKREEQKGDESYKSSEGLGHDRVQGLAMREVSHRGGAAAGGAGITCGGEKAAGRQVEPDGVRAVAFGFGRHPAAKGEHGKTGGEDQTADQAGFEPLATLDPFRRQFQPDGGDGQLEDSCTV